jgi:hypothetical protein
MNSLLLAVLVFLVREAWVRGQRLQLAGVTDEFRAWASTFNLLRPLEQVGVLLAPVKP